MQSLDCLNPPVVDGFVHRIRNTNRASEACLDEIRFGGVRVVDSKKDRLPETQVVQAFTQRVRMEEGAHGSRALSRRRCQKLTGSGSEGSR